MIVYQPWIEIGGCDGEYATHRFNLHLKQENAMKELTEKLNYWRNDRRIVIIKKGISDVEILE